MNTATFEKVMEFLFKTFFVGSYIYLFVNLGLNFGSYLSEMDKLAKNNFIFSNIIGFLALIIVLIGYLISARNYFLDKEDKLKIDMFKSTIGIKKQKKTFFRRIFNFIGRVIDFIIIRPLEKIYLNIFSSVLILSLIKAIIFIILLFKMINNLYVFPVQNQISKNFYFENIVLFEIFPIAALILEYSRKVAVYKKSQAFLLFLYISTFAASVEFIKRDLSYNPYEFLDTVKGPTNYLIFLMIALISMLIQKYIFLYKGSISKKNFLDVFFLFAMILCILNVFFEFAKIQTFTSASIVLGAFGLYEIYKFFKKDSKEKILNIMNLSILILIASLPSLVSLLPKGIISFKL